MTRLWRWLCCRTGHHRETAEIYATPHGFKHSVDWKCVDCGHYRFLLPYSYPVRTPSRRYALRGKA